MWRDAPQVPVEWDGQGLKNTRKTLHVRGMRSGVTSQGDNRCLRSATL